MGGPGLWFSGTEPPVPHVGFEPASRYSRWNLVSIVRWLDHSATCSILLKPWQLQYQTIISFDDISFLVKDKKNQILPDLWRYFRQFYHKRENKKCSTLIRLWCLIVLIKWEWTKKTACKNLFSFSFSKPLKFWWWRNWSQKNVFPV